MVFEVFPIQYNTNTIQYTIQLLTFNLFFGNSLLILKKLTETLLRILFSVTQPLEQFFRF